MKVLVACEQSGTVRDAFLALGHDAWSCDIEPSITPSNRHIQADVRDTLVAGKWDMMVAHPPCTRLCNSGVRWLSEPPENRQEGYPVHWSDMSREEKLEWLWSDLERGAELFSDMLNADVPMIAVENPVMHKHAKARIKGYQKFAQTVQPWQFAKSEDGPDNVKKRTCLWLKGLPTLKATGSLDGSTARDDVHKKSPGKDRRMARSIFFPGIAQAMAEQWGAMA